MLSRIVTNAGIIALICAASVMAEHATTPTPSGELGSDDCGFKIIGSSYGACVMPPKVCPNGPFTGSESCSAARSNPGCTGASSSLVSYSGDTGLKLVQVGCGAIGNTYSVTSCICFGNLFGFCTGPCQPNGGLVEANRPCPGVINQLRRCEREG